MNVKKFVRIVSTVFEKIEKVEKRLFFGLILTMFLTFKSYDFDANEHAGDHLGV